MEPVCIGCGCSDEDPCEGGCSWVSVNEDLGAGLCSQCAAKPLDELIEKIENNVAAAARA